MRRVILWLLLLGVTLALAVFAARSHDGMIGALDNQDVASLIVKIGALLLVGGAVMMLFRDRFSKALEYALIWVVIALVLVLGYTYRFDLRDISDKVMAELIPGRVASKGRVVELARGGAGDFQISTGVNGQSVSMVLDTGASMVVLTHEAA